MDAQIIATGIRKRGFILILGQPSFSGLRFFLCSYSTKLWTSWVWIALIHCVSVIKLLNHLDLDFSFFKSSIMIVGLLCFPRMLYVKKKRSLLRYVRSLWKVIYKAQIKLLILNRSINTLPVSEGTISPKPHSILDTTANSHDLISELVTALAKRVWHKWRILQPSVFLIHTFSLRTFLIDAQGIYFTILISICLTLMWDSFLLILEKSNFSYLQLD